MCKMIADEMPENIRNYVESANVTERGFPTGTQEEVDDLANFIAENVELVVARLSAEDADLREQEVFLAAAEFMVPSAYVEFLDRMVEELAVRQTPNYLKTVERGLDAGTKKLGFLAFNFRHQAIIELCEKAQKTLPVESRLQTVLTDILSGEQKLQIGAALFMENLPRPETLPQE